MCDSERKDLITKLDEKIIQAGEEFLANPTLGWAVSNVPVFGPVITTIF
jgi:hypothetical protein